MSTEIPPHSELVSGSTGSGLGHSYPYVFSYWHQGEAAAPEVVSLCVNRMRALSGEGGVIVHDQVSQSEFESISGIPRSRFEQMPLAHLSDLIRTSLLIQHGGVWADPTVYFNQPLEDWLPALVEPSGIFLFHRPGRDREISNWFIAAQAGHPILVSLFERLCDFWAGTDFRNARRRDNAFERNVFRIVNRNRWASRIWTRPWINRLTRLFPYMIYHYVFYDIVCTDRRLRQIWERTPKVSAAGPIALARLGLSQPVTPEARHLIDNPTAPVYKLKWRLPDDAVPEGSILHALSEQAKF